MREPGSGERPRWSEIGDPGVSVGRAISEDMDGSGSCPMSTTGPCLAVSELQGYPAGGILSGHQADPSSRGRAERRVWRKCLGFLENALLPRPSVLGVSPLCPSHLPRQFLLIHLRSHALLACATGGQSIPKLQPRKLTWQIGGEGIAGTLQAHLAAKTFLLMAELHPQNDRFES